LAQPGNGFSPVKELPTKTRQLKTGMNRPPQSQLTVKTPSPIFQRKLFVAAELAPDVAAKYWAAATYVRVFQPNEFSEASSERHGTGA
jgi:hypothetical protein